MLSALEMIVSLFLWSLVSMGAASSLPRQADMRLINPLPNDIIINKTNNTLVLVFILRLLFYLNLECKIPSPFVSFDANFFDMPITINKKTKLITIAKP